MHSPPRPQPPPNPCRSPPVHHTDADFGYVGGAPGKIDLYVGKEVVKRAIPMEGVSHRRLTCYLNALCVVCN